MTVVAHKALPFSLTVHVSAKKTIIQMQLHSTVYRTGALPMTLDFLRAHYPEVLRTRCFNDQHHPFEIEVKDTEIGHLFEHILLAALLRQNESEKYTGVTVWNWKKEPRGLFRITVNVGEKDRGSLFHAIDTAHTLTTRLLTTHTNGWGVQPSVQSFALTV